MQQKWPITRCRCSKAAPTASPVPRLARCLWKILVVIAGPHSSGSRRNNPFFLPLRSRARGASFSICSAVLQASQETNDEVQTRYLPSTRSKQEPASSCLAEDLHMPPPHQQTSLTVNGSAFCDHLQVLISTWLSSSWQAGFSNLGPVTRPGHL